MLEEILDYENYLLNFNMVKKPQMPKFDVSAYTDNEYQIALFQIMSDFENVNDEHLIISYLKGD